MLIFFIFAFASLLGLFATLTIANNDIKELIILFLFTIILFVSLGVVLYE